MQIIVVKIKLDDGAKSSNTNIAPERKQYSCIPFDLSWIIVDNYLKTISKDCCHYLRNELSHQ